MVFSEAGGAVRFETSHSVTVQETKGVEEVVTRETPFYDNILDWNAPWPEKWVEVHNVYASGDRTFTEQTLIMMIKGVGRVGKSLLLSSKTALRTTTIG